MNKKENEAAANADDAAIQSRIFGTEEKEREEALEELLTTRAAPLIETILSRYRTVPYSASDDRDDLLSIVRLRVLRYLRRAASSGENSLRNLNDYIARLTYNSVHDALRRRFPERTRLKNRLRYAMIHDDRFVLLQRLSETLCALRSWPELAPAKIPNASRVPEFDILLDRKQPAEAIHTVLEVSGGPLFFDEIVGFFAGIWGITDTENIDDRERVDEGSSPLTLAEHRQTLAIVIGEIRELPSLQRAALLFNLRDSGGDSASAFFLLAGAATFDELAGMMGVSPEELAELWNDLPLDDLTIGARLGRTRQQVINLRKSARDRLTRRLRNKEKGRQ